MSDRTYANTYTPALSYVSPYGDKGEGAKSPPDVGGIKVGRLSISRFSPLTPALSQWEREYFVSPRPLGEGRG